LPERTVPKGAVTAPGVTAVSKVTDTRDPTLTDLPAKEHICATTVITAIKAISAIASITGIRVTTIKAITASIRADMDISVVTAITILITAHITARTEDPTDITMTDRQEKSRRKLRDIVLLPRSTTTRIRNPGFFMARVMSSGKWD
jgi:hypothetical protein